MSAFDDLYLFNLHRQHRKSIYVAPYRINAMNKEDSQLLAGIVFLVLVFAVLSAYNYIIGNKESAPGISPVVDQKLENSISEQLNSEEKINIIIYTYSGQNQDNVKILQNMGAENVKLVESTPVQGTGMTPESLYITATIKSKDATRIGELSWVRRIERNLQTSQ